MLKFGDDVVRASQYDANRKSNSIVVSKKGNPYVRDIFQSLDSHKILPSRNDFIRAYIIVYSYLWSEITLDRSDIHRLKTFEQFLLWPSKRKVIFSSFDYLFKWIVWLTSHINNIDFYWLMLATVCILFQAFFFLPTE